MAFKLRSGKTTTFKAMGSRPLKLKDPEDKEKIEVIQPPKRSNKSFGRDTEEAVKTDPTIDTSKMYNRNLRIDEKLTDDSGTGYITKQNISREEWDKKPSQPHYKTTDKPIMTEFGTSDAVYVGDGGEVLHRGDVYDDDGNIIKGAKQKYMGPVGGFDESETLRIGRTQGRSQLGLKPESQFPVDNILKDELTGRRKVKGDVIEQLDDNAVESYMEGDKINKRTRRKKGTLDIEREKVKDKKKGYVRKTGEGFLGLQKRKKYIDGDLLTPELKDKIKAEKKAKRTLDKTKKKQKRQKIKEDKKNPQLIFNAGTGKWVHNPNYKA